MEISRALVAVTRATRYANRIALYTPTRIVIGSRQKSPFRLLATLALQSFSLHQSLSSPLLSAPSYSRNLQNRSFSSILSIRFHCVYRIILMNEKRESNGFPFFQNLRNRSKKFHVIDSFSSCITSLFDHFDERERNLDSNRTVFLLFFRI